MEMEMEMEIGNFIANLIYLHSRVCNLVGKYSVYVCIHVIHSVMCNARTCTYIQYTRYDSGQSQ